MRSYEKLTEILSLFKEVEAVSLAGSSCNKIHDENSDYDVYVYYNSHIDYKKREEAFKDVFGNVNVNSSLFEEGDSIYIDNEPYIDIMYRDKKWIEEQVDDVWVKCNARSGYTTCFLSSIYNSSILFTRSSWYEELQNKIKGKYPEKLKENIIKQNLSLIDGYVEQIIVAAKRSDYVSLNHRVSALLSSVFDILFANSEVLHPGEKKLEKYLKELNVKTPPSFKKELNDVLQNTYNKEKLPSLVKKMYLSLKKFIDNQ